MSMTLLDRARAAELVTYRVADNVATLLRSPAERARLAAAGPTDATAWSAPVLMEKVVALYRQLGKDRAPHISSEISTGDPTI